jgi:glyoxylase-like metal-dependent hydrolase (beta-lactamase superfamily II)
MHTTQIGQNIFLIDLQTGGFSNLIGCYVLKGEKVTLVETGPTSSIPNLLSGLRELNINPEDVTYVAVTHVHADHSGGAGTLMKYLPNAKIIVHSKGAPHLESPEKLWAATKETLGYAAGLFGEPEPIQSDKIIVASENLTFHLEPLELMIVETPGHASHSLCYFEQMNSGLFSGDSAGAYISRFDAVFPTTPPPFRPDVALISLEKLVKLNPIYLYYSHFGVGSNAIKRLQNYAIQINMWLRLVEKGLSHGDSPETIRETIFKEDETIRHVVAMLKANPVHRKTLIENSVQGFINFVKRPQI